MPVARRPVVPVRRWLVPAAFAATVLAYAQVAAQAQMQPLVPYRLTHNGPGEFTYATHAKINEVGYQLQQNTAGGSFANAFAFLNGNVTHRLSANSAPGRLAEYAGRIGGRFVVSETMIVGSPHPANTAINLVLHDGQSGIPVTHNPLGFLAQAQLAHGEFIFSNSEVDARSREIRRNVFQHGPSGSANLTLNPLGAFSSPHLKAPGNLFIFSTYDGELYRRDLTFSRLDGSPTLQLTSGGQADFDIRGGPGAFIYRLAPDVFLFDGKTATNLTNNSPGFRSSFAGFAGSDIIFRLSTPDERHDLLRYRNGTLINMTNNVPGVDCLPAGTEGADVIFRTEIGGTILEQAQSNYSRNDASSNTNTALTHNSMGMSARLERVDVRSFIEIADHRLGGGLQETVRAPRDGRHRIGERAVGRSFT